MAFPTGSGIQVGLDSSILGPRYEAGFREWTSKGQRQCAPPSQGNFSKRTASRHDDHANGLAFFTIRFLAGLLDHQSGSGGKIPQDGGHLIHLDNGGNMAVDARDLLVLAMNGVSQILDFF